MSHDESIIHGQHSKRVRLTKYLPEFVYGGIDGLVTTFAVVAGATGANLDLSVVLILWFANLFADGFSMSVGAFMASKSEHDNYAKNLALEYREIDNLRDREVQEIRDIYAAKWFTGELLEQVVAKIIDDKDRRVDVMMKEELWLSLPEKKPFAIWLSTLTSFVIIGFIPLLSYVIAFWGSLDESKLFPLAMILTGLGFAIIGWLKSYVNETNKRRSVIETLLLGWLAATVAYYVGFVLEKMIG